MTAFVALFGENLVDRFGNAVKTVDALHDRGVALYILDESTRTPRSSNASASSRSIACAHHFATSMHTLYPSLVNKGVEVVCIAAPATTLAVPSPPSLKLERIHLSRSASTTDEDASHVSNVIQTLKSSESCLINVIGSAEALLEGKAERCAQRMQRESRLQPIVELEAGATRDGAAERDKSQEQVAPGDGEEGDDVAPPTQNSAHAKLNAMGKGDNHAENNLSLDIFKDATLTQCSSSDLHSYPRPSRGTSSMSSAPDGTPLAETGVIGQPPPKFCFISPKSVMDDNLAATGDEESKTWLHLPVKERTAACTRLCAQFQVTIFPALIVFNVNGEVVTKDGRGRLMSDPEAFPYSSNSSSRSFTPLGRTGSLFPPQFNMGPLDPKAIDGMCLEKDRRPVSF